MLKRIVFVFFTTILLGANVAAAQPPTLESASDVASQLAIFTREAQANGEVSIIVGFSTPLDGQELSAQAVESQEAAIQSARTAVVRSLAGTNTQIDANSLNWVIPYVAMTVDEAGLQALAENPAITSIERNELSYNFLASSVPSINADDVWTRGYTGTGRAVVVIDSGVERTHPFFGGRVIYEACFSGNGNSVWSNCPNGQVSQTGTGAAALSACLFWGMIDCDHGTHVAGIVGGNGASYDGVAPNVSIIGINAGSDVAGSNQVGYYDSDLITSLNHVYNIRGSYNIAAVNMSLGGGRYFGYCDAQEAALANIIGLLRSVQIATVIATGNNQFEDSISSPACISSAISVGSTNDSTTVSWFSNRHPIMTVFAPGENVQSSVLNGAYGSKGGTSMAAPHVAGAIALLRQAKPSLTVGEIIMALERTGPTISIPGSTERRIDVNAALNWVLSQMLVNNDFFFNGAGWTTFPTGGMTTQVTGGVYQFYSNTSGAALLQSTGRSVPLGNTVEAEFLLGNSSPNRRRFSVLVHDNDFSDLSVCSFWVPGNSPLSRYRMQMRTTEAWSNATISFYPSQTGNAWLRLDNVALRNIGNFLSANSTICYNPLQTSPTGVADSANLINNGTFASPITPANPNGNWAVFGPIAYDASGGVFRFNQQGGLGGGTVFQNSGDAIPVNTVVEARFTMQNTSTTRMRFTVLLHNSTFSDLNVCTFWLPPNSVNTFYTMLTHTTQPWANAAISIYPSRAASGGWLVLDNVTLHSRGTQGTTGTECYPFSLGVSSLEGQAEAEVIAPTLEPTATPALPAGELPLLPTSMPEGMEAAESIQQEGMIGE